MYLLFFGYTKAKYEQNRLKITKHNQDERLKISDPFNQINNLTKEEFMMPTVNVIGAGLAGSEAAWQIAQAGVDVNLYEMRPREDDAGTSHR